MDELLLVEMDGDVAVAEVTTPKLLDESNVELFGAKLFALIDEHHHRQVVLDLQRLDYMSSAANSKLIGFERLIQKAGGRFAICGVRSDIYEVFAITRLNKLFRIFRDRKDAVGWLQGLASGRTVMLATVCPLVDCRAPVFLSRCDIFPCPMTRETWTISCTMCGATMTASGFWPPKDGLVRAGFLSITLNTYENEHVILLPPKWYGGLAVIQVAGRLDLFAAETVELAWRSLPAPRWVILDLNRATEVREKGIRHLVEYCESDRGDRRAAVVIIAEQSAPINGHFPHAVDINDAIRTLAPLPEANSETMIMELQTVESN